tara:strand:+ start:849 stop:1415 length:567 start_codon:yes stop_codon:yes gene_type:complete
MNIIDIGSHNGKTASPTYRYTLNDKYKVYHVEPNPYLHEDLQKHNSTLLKYGVSDYNGRGKLYFDKRGFNNRQKGSHINKLTGMRSSFLKENEYLGSFLTDNFVEVDMITLDKLIDDLDLKKIHLLKIDTEGFDFRILKHYSWKIKPAKIITEDFIETKQEKYELLIIQGYNLIKSDNSDSYWQLEDQ